MNNTISPVVTMCEPLAPNIITSADGRTYDLTALESPIALPPNDVVYALREWPHGFCFLASNGKWVDCCGAACLETTYRAKPAPKVTEHVLHWCVERGGWAGYHKTPGDTHKITMTHTGDTLPFGTYKLEGSDATITVGKAE